MSLILRGVSAGYSTSGSTQRPELAEVDLEVRPGQIVCVLGPNGAGKTTLVRVASGLLSPFQGEVRLLDQPVVELTRGQIARILAVVEQREEIAGNFTVREVVAMGRAPHQGSWMRGTEADDAIVEDAIQRCDLTTVAARSAGALSGGEQKRVAVARALTQEPKVLLLDEPGSFFDVRHQLDLYELLHVEVKTKNLACLVVMHDLNIASQFADRVVLMKAGRVIAAGTVEEVMT